MTEILQNSLPDDLARDGRLPGIRPLVDGRWLRTDDAYAQQMQYRRALLAEKSHLVLNDGDQAAQEAAAEALEEACKLMPDMGFDVTATYISCPDGTRQERQGRSALEVLGNCLQEDICIMQKRGDEHVLTAAVLCFPASWTLSEKIMRPLTAIHVPVADYTDELARRVQRLFDGVGVERPLWRNNMLGYDQAELFTPRSESDPVRVEVPMDRSAFIRAERQCILRLPKTRACVFSIHTYMVRNQISNEVPADPAIACPTESHRE